MLSDINLLATLEPRSCEMRGFKISNLFGEECEDDYNCGSIRNMFQANKHVTGIKHDKNLGMTVYNGLWHNINRDRYALGNISGHGYFWNSW